MFKLRIFKGSKKKAKMKRVQHLKNVLEELTSDAWHFYGQGNYELYRAYQKKAYGAKRQIRRLTL